MDLKYEVQALGQVSLDGIPIQSGEYLDTLNLFAPFPLLGVDYWSRVTDRWHVGGEFTFIAEGTGNFIPGTGIILNDLKLGHQVDLLQSPWYDFSYELGDDPERFLLTFTGLMGVPDTEYDQGISISVSGRQILVESGVDNGEIYLYNLAGQILDCMPLSPPQTSLPVPGGNVCVLCIHQKGRISTYTVFVH